MNWAQAASLRQRGGASRTGDYGSDVDWGNIDGL